jgi:predicted Rossmann fold nucleotide-binding protein DprA/Smf involved in DNA uptake
MDSYLLPPTIYKRLSPAGIDSAKSLSGIGNSALLNAPLLAFIASRSCPGHILLQTMEQIPGWVEVGKVILSGFHSPLEQQVLRSALRRSGRVVKVLARGMTGYRAAPEEKTALDNGRMLVMTAFPSTVRRTARETALERNRLVLAMAAECCIPWLSEDSPLRDSSIHYQSYIRCK